MSKIIRDETSEESSPITINDRHYSLGRDDGETLLSRVTSDYIRKHGKYENNTGPTARVLKELTSEPAWYQKLGASIGLTSRSDRVFLCRVISDHRTSCLVEPLSADDNVMSLPYPKFILPGDSPKSKIKLGPGDIVRVRMDDNHTMFTCGIAGTIEHIIDTDATLEQGLSNCGTIIPGPGGSPRSTVEQSCSGTSRSGRGRAIKMANTKPPRPARGEYPKSPITGLRANSSPPTIRRDGPYEIPRIGRVNSGFPVRNDGVTAHKGVDFRTTVNGVISIGAPIKAALDGTAIIGEINGYGYVVAIKHTAYKADTPDSTFWTFYAHMLPHGRITGPVRAGQEIGKSGNSSGQGGFTSTPHLHFEVIYDNNPSWTKVEDVITGGAVDPITDFLFNRFEKK